MADYNVLRNADGKAIAAGYCDFTPGAGETVKAETYTQTILDEVKTTRAAIETAKTSAYDAKVSGETLTLGELIKLLKAKGVI